MQPAFPRADPVRAARTALASATFLTLCAASGAAALAFAVDPTIFTDENDGCVVGAGRSLREAIDESVAGDTILLAAGTYQVSVANSAITGENVNATSDLDVTTNKLTIVGAGVAQTTVAQTGSGTDVDGVFHVLATLAVSNLTVRGGDRASNAGGAPGRAAASGWASTARRPAT